MSSAATKIFPGGNVVMQRLKLLAAAALGVAVIASPVAAEPLKIKLQYATVGQFVPMIPLAPKELYPGFLTLSECIGASNLRKLFCEKQLLGFERGPRCRQSVAQLRSILHAPRGARWWRRSTAVR
jgi:hypothetical protein